MQTQPIIPKLKIKLKANPSSEDVPQTDVPLTPEQEQAKQRELMESKLLETIDTLWQIELRAGDVAEGQEEFLVDDLQTLVASYKDMSELASQMTESVHYSAVQQVDADMNPHKHTRDLLGSALRANQLGNARIKAYESYHDTLADVIGQAFPDLTSVLQPINKPGPLPTTTQATVQGQEPQDTKAEQVKAEMEDVKMDVQG